MASNSFHATDANQKVETEKMLIVCGAPKKLELSEAESAQLQRILITFIEGLTGLESHEDVLIMRHLKSQSANALVTWVLRVEFKLLFMAFVLGELRRSIPGSDSTELGRDLELETLDCILLNEKGNVKQESFSPQEAGELIASSTPVLPRDIWVNDLVATELDKISENIKDRSEVPVEAHLTPEMVEALGEADVGYVSIPKVMERVRLVPHLLESIAEVRTESASSLPLEEIFEIHFKQHCV